MLSSDSKYYLKLFLIRRGKVVALLRFMLLMAAWTSFLFGRFCFFCRLLGKQEKLNEFGCASGLNAILYQDLVFKRTALLEGKFGKNAIVDSYLSSSQASSIRSRYAKYGAENSAHLRYHNEDDPRREGNLLVLAEPVLASGAVLKKGVLYLQYNNSLFEFVALFDLEKVYSHFVLVFEPSSWGYSDLCLELLLSGEHHVFVMSQDAIDFDYVKSLDRRLVPIRAGAGDWINLAAVDSVRRDSKDFDVCMVASWRKIKNHRLMFSGLSSLGRGLRIALVGYTWERRTVASVRAEQNRYYPDSIVSVFESVPHRYVFDVLCSSRLALMLSEREGANRGVYEALACNVPVLMLDTNRGVNRQLVEHDCVILCSRENLAATASKILEAKQSLNVGEKIRSISGHKNTWNLIRNTIEQNFVTSMGEEPWIASTPNLKYVNPTLKQLTQESYRLLESFLR